MSDRSDAERTWRHTAAGRLLRDRLELVRCATLAASSHNTQPWRFQRLPDRIRILPDAKQNQKDTRHIQSSSVPWRRS